MDIKNSTILITGGTSGIGMEMAKQMLALGATDIIVTGRDAHKLEQIKAKSPQLHLFQSDVSKPEDIHQLASLVTQQFPKLNVLINNAGIMRNLNLLDQQMTIENLTTEIDINLTGTVRMVQQFLPHLLAQPRATIVNVSSGLAFLPFPLSPIYSAAKAGVHAYTQVLRLQLNQTNVKVIELAPPSTDTPLGDAFVGLVDPSQSMKTDKLVRLAIEGMLQDASEIKPGLAKVLKAMSRLAPNAALTMLNATLQKAKAKL